MKMYIYEYIVAGYDYIMKYNELVIIIIRYNLFSFIKVLYFY